MTDDDLRRAVAAELCWDPRVDSATIEVSAASGMVTLRGTAASLWHKWRGATPLPASAGSAGSPMNSESADPDRDRRDDEDLRGDVLETLMLEGSVPMTVDAQARDGFVTLTGTVEWHYQREVAESHLRACPAWLASVTPSPWLRFSMRVPGRGCHELRRSGAMPCWTRTGSRSRPSPAGWQSCPARSAPGPRAITQWPPPGPRLASPTSMIA